MSELEYYLRISNHLAGELDIRSALRAVKGEIDKIIDVDHLDVCLIDSDKYCNTSYEVGLRTNWSTTRALVSVSPVRDVLLGKTDAMLTPDATADPRYMFAGGNSEPIVRHGLRSRINVAMKVLGRTIGALNCSSRKLDYYTEDNLAQVKVLADILAPYFFALSSSDTAKREAVRRARVESEQEGLRRGALRLTEALEAERQRIGMDLHDQTLAEMTGVAREVSTDLTADASDRIQRRIQNCIQQLRQIIDSSIPSILELFGFEEAVHSHFETLSGSKPNLRFEYADNAEGKIEALHDTTRTALFRICQEAINNAVTHAEATKVEVSVEAVEDGSLVVTISDDGSFKAPKEKRQGGLTHMQTRAGLIGASFFVSKIDGTRVTIGVPIVEDEETQ